MNRPPFFRRTFLVRPKLQLKYALITASIAFVSVSLVGTVAYLTLKEGLIHFLNSSYEHDPHLIQFVEQRLWQTLWIIIALLLGLVVVLIFASIWLTHQFAGPLNKLSNVMGKILDDQPVDSIQFRKGDEFQDLAKKFNKIIKKLK